MEFTVRCASLPSLLINGYLTVFSFLILHYSAELWGILVATRWWPASTAHPFTHTHPRTHFCKTFFFFKCSQSADVCIWSLCLLCPQVGNRSNCDPCTNPRDTNVQKHAEKYLFFDKKHTHAFIAAGSFFPPRAKVSLKCKRMEMGMVVFDSDLVYR